MKKPVIFLDRDGTINDDPGYLSDPAQFILLPGALEGMAALQAKGFELIVITNQSGIGRGYFNQADLNQVHARMCQLLAAAGITLRGIYICPHAPEEQCNCRKPLTGLIEQACAEHEIDLSRSWMVGDKEADVQLGINLNLRTAQIIGKYPLHPGVTHSVKSLVDLAPLITID